MMDVPAPVQPPAGQKAAMTWTGTGELTYECRAKADNASMFEWAFVGPDAKLCGCEVQGCDGEVLRGTHLGDGRRQQDHRQAGRRRTGECGQYSRSSS